MQTDNDMLLRLKKELDHLEKSHKVGLVSKEEFEKNKERIEKKMLAIDQRKKDQAYKQSIVHEILNEKTRKGVKEENAEGKDQKEAHAKIRAKQEKKIRAEKEVQSTQISHKKTKIDDQERKKKEEKKETKVKKSLGSKRPEKETHTLSKEKDEGAKAEEFFQRREKRESTTRWNIMLTALVILLLVLIFLKLRAQVPSDQVTITEYADYGCSYCAQAQETLNELENIYGDKLIFQFRYFPLDESEGMYAAMAAECANNQGKFWEYHEMLFAHYEQLSMRDLQQYALDVNLNFTEFNACLSSEETKKEVLREKKEGEKKGVQWTPTFFVNNQMIVGAVDRETFQKAIETELQKQAQE